MRKDQSLLASVSKLVAELERLHHRAVVEFKPIVDSIIRSRSRDVRHIEQTLDRLLDFCGYDPALELFRRLCRYYYFLDPEATAYYVHSYREMWDSEEAEPTSTPD